MNQRTPIPAVLAAVVLAGCSSFSVATQMEPGADISPPKSFAWAPEQELGVEGSRVDREHVASVLASSLGEALAAKGITPAADPASADLLAAFQVDFEHKVYATAFPEYSHSAWTYRTFYARPVSTDVMITEYDVGNLVVDLVDARTRRLLWRGRVAAEVDPMSPRDTKVRTARGAVEALFREFPGK